MCQSEDLRSEEGLMSDFKFLLSLVVSGVISIGGPLPIFLIVNNCSVQASM